MTGHAVLISSVRIGKSHKVEVSISIIFAGDGRNSCSDRCALNDNVTKNSRDRKGTPSVPRIVEPTFREGPRIMLIIHRPAPFADTFALPPLKSKLTTSAFKDFVVDKFFQDVIVLFTS